MSVRVYVPVTSSTLARLVADRRLPGPLRAHAVTDGLREAWGEGGDDESWEYAALMAAADDSAARRGAADTPRRHVLAADVSQATPVPGESPTLVEVPGDLLWKHLAAAHVDTADDPSEDDDLAWFATQEIPQLL